MNTATGNYLLQRTDLAIPGRGLPFIFTRTYNSLDTYSGPLGHGWTHSYNVLLIENMDGVVVIKFGDGQEEFYDPTGDGRYESRFAGVFNELVKNPDETFVLTAKDQTQHEFSVTGQLVRIGDRNGNSLSFSYDGSGNLTTITDTVGRTVVLNYDRDNRITQLIDPIERTIQYAYDVDGNLETDTDPGGGVTLYQYDPAHLVTRIIDPRRNTLLEHSYDEAGRVVSQTNGRGFTTHFAYEVPQSGDTSITDPLGNTTIHTHDEQLRLIKVTDALSNTVAFTYDEDNNRTGITDQNGNLTRLTYDDRGNLTSITDPLLNVTDLTYDAINNLTRTTDARRFTTTLAYDAKGNLISAEDALKNITTLAYDDFGQVLWTTNAWGNTTHHAYDEQGNLTEITDALGGQTVRAYDGIGRLVGVIDPKGHTLTVSYDANSRVIQIVDALELVDSYIYDPVGNLVEITDAEGNTTQYDYDEVNNITLVTDALGHITSYTYDANDNRIGLVDASSHSRTSTFDALNQPITTSDALGNTTTYAYDAAGNVVAVTDPNGTTSSFAYDANNFLKEIAYGDGSSVAYSYDANGNRSSMEDRRGTTTYAYDAQDQLTEVTHPDGDVVSYVYDAVGKRARLIYPDGRTASYEYDALNRLTGVKGREGRQTQYSYDTDGNLIRIIYPNRTTISYHYDAADRLEEVRNQRNERILAQFLYKLDGLGNRTEIIASGLNISERTLSYTYDALSQLIAEHESGPRGSQTRTEYSYDPVGNRLTQTRSLIRDDGTALPTEVITYTYDNADRLLQAGSTSFIYDNNGNRVAETTMGDRGNEYAYDAANRLIRVVQDERAAAYVYDGDGNKVEQALSAGPHVIETFRYLNDVATPLPVVLQEDRAEKGGTIHYLYGLALISEELARPGHDAQQFFYHSDGLESTIALTDRTGRTRAGYQYDAWGNLKRSSETVPNRFRFTGEEQDSQTGLYNLRARWYDPQVGRFLTKDLFGGIARLPQSLNEYVYVLNNPNTRVDPTGWFSFKRVFKTVARVAIAVAIAGPVPTALAAASNALPFDGVDVTFPARVVSTIALFNPSASSVGLTLGFAGWLADPKLSDIRIGWGAIEFTNNRGVEWLPGDRDAITLGNVILYKHGPDARRHEYNHVLQSTFLGPQYIPAHLGFGAVSWGICGRSWWQCNPLERLTSPAPQALTITK